MAMIKIWYIKNKISKEQIKLLLKTNGYLTFFYITSSLEKKDPGVSTEG